MQSWVRIALLAGLACASLGDRALAQVRYVATAGSDRGECAEPGAPCATVAYAVSRAASGDTVRIAQGTYAGSVRIDKPLVLEGDYAAGFQRTPQRDPGRTVLDGGGGGRPLTITGAATQVTLDGLRIANGNATGAAPRPGAGGGVLVAEGATLSAQDVWIDHNVASAGAGPGFGGGMAIVDGSATLTRVDLTENQAKAGGSGGGFGGALYLAGANGAGRAILSLTHCEILSNRANASAGAGAADEASGGGLYVGESGQTELTCFENAWEQNVARATTAGPGAGLGGALAVRQAGRRAVLDLDSDQFKANVANAANGLQAQLARGGALFLEADNTGEIDAMLLDVSMLDNVAKGGTGPAGGAGGALWAERSALQWAGGTVANNVAATAGAESGEGGALRLSHTSLLASEMAFQGNHALRDGSGPQRGSGGGIALFNDGAGVPLALTNVFLVDNVAAASAAGRGGALYIEDRAGGANLNARHLTIAQNQSRPGDQAIHVEAGGIELTNVLVSGYTIGLRNGGAGAVRLLPFELFAVEQDVAGAVDGLDAILHGAPGFVDPAVADYNLTAASAAVDAGSDAGIMRDLDGDPRPAGDGFDIGADEYIAGQPTRTRAPTAPPTQDPTATPTPPPSRNCVGDCNGDGQVSVNELVLAVNITLGTVAVSECPACDADGNGTAEINELVQGVTGALQGCG